MNQAKNNIDVSVIIPVYNVAAYIEESLESLLKQNFSGNIQIILINDKSEDDSGKICKRYTVRHPEKIFYIEHDANQGTSAARNNGLSAATGEYFTFVDPDDLVPQDGIRLLYEKAKLRDVDIVKGNNSIFNQHSEKPAPYNTNKDILIEEPDILSTFLKHKLVRGHPWGKLFRTRTFKDVRFTPGITMAQDLLWNVEVFSQAQRILISNIDTYRYRLREDGSTGKKYHSGAYLDWLASVEACGKFAKSPRERKAYVELLIKTLHQITKEVRGLPQNSLASTLGEIRIRINNWDISYALLARRNLLLSKSLWRYLQIMALLRRLSKKAKSLPPQ